MENKNLKFAVISHTHWDREWYTPFENFRLRLVDLIDRLLQIIETDNSYIFHLDAQTVVLEDYLEIRPEREALLKKYIRSGNIIVGPWYLQNDFYYTCGEATIRNLMRGSRLAKAFGACSKVGYAPDQFGNISQLPQILKNFGIDSFVFGRGYKKVVKDENGYPKEIAMPAEFVWRGADGSELLAVFLKGWYNNAQHIPVETELAEELLEENVRLFQGLNISDTVLLMNGVDHLEAQPDINEALANLQKSGYSIRQYSLDEYIGAVKEYFKEHDCRLSVFKGALNKGHDGDMLKGCRSSRSYLKRENVRAEDLLVNKLEPLYAFLETNGFCGAYPHDHFEYLWKTLMQNHPHDSICGCSRDAVHAHMLDRYARIRECGEDLLQRGMKILSAHTENKFREEENYRITAFNPSERAFTGVIESALNFLRAENISEFALLNENGETIAYEIVHREKGVLDVVSPLNLPGVLDVERVKIRFADTVPACGVRSYAVVPHRGGVSAERKYEAIENDCYLLQIENNRLSITDKDSGCVYENPFYIEDEADKGDSYLFRKSPASPLTIEPVKISVTENSVYKKTVNLQFIYDCPADYDYRNDCRTVETEKMEIFLDISLNGDAKALELNCRVKNRCCQHRVRLGVRAGVSGDTLITDSPFDWGIKGLEDCGEYTEDPTTCNSTFVSAGSKKRGVCLFTEGLHEAEKKEKDVMLTLVRATGIIARLYDYTPSGGEMMRAPENQCLREMQFRTGAVFGCMTPGECYVAAKQFRVGVLTLADSFDAKKYSGGRFAVQAGYSRLYYLPDEYKGCSVANCGMLSFEGEDVCLSAYKCDENGNTILRFFNFSEGERELSLRCRGTVEITDMAEGKGYGTVRNRFTCKLSPKQIITLRVKSSLKNA